MNNRRNRFKVFHIEEPKMDSPFPPRSRCNKEEEEYSNELVQYNNNNNYNNNYNYNYNSNGFESDYTFPSPLLKASTTTRSITKCDFVDDVESIGSSSKEFNNRLDGVYSREASVASSVASITTTTTTTVTKKKGRYNNNNNKENLIHCDGIVKYYKYKYNDPQDSYGFIGYLDDPNKKDIFFHHDSVRIYDRYGRVNIKKDDYVSFDIFQQQNGRFKAVNVTRTTTFPPPPQQQQQRKNNNFRRKRNPQEYFNTRKIKFDSGPKFYKKFNNLKPISQTQTPVLPPKPQQQQQEKEKEKEIPKEKKEIDITEVEEPKLDWVRLDTDGYESESDAGYQSDISCKKS